MPTLNKPTSDENRLHFMNKTVDTGTSDTNAGKAYLSAEILAKAQTMHTNFNGKMNDLAGTLSGREKEVREKNQAIATLNTYVRDCWEVLKRRVYRNDEPTEVFTFYGLPLDGTVEPSLSVSDLLAMAQTIISGDVKAIAAGYNAIICPSADEISTVLANTQKEIAEVAPADRLYSDAQQAVASMRQEVDVLIDDIIAELEFNLRKLEASTRRRIMRSYGVTYKYASGESHDSDDTTDSQESTTATTTE